jgi:hypothetical protein
MEIINEKLKEYEKLHNFFDAWLVVAVRGDLEPCIPDKKKKGEVRKMIEKKKLGREDSSLYCRKDKIKLGMTRVD